MVSVNVRVDIHGMNLLDEAVKLQHRPGSPCAVSNLKEANPTLYAELLDALATTVQCSALSKALKSRDVYLTSDTLNRHRRGDCTLCRS